MISFADFRSVPSESELEPSHTTYGWLKAAPVCLVLLVLVGAPWFRGSVLPGAQFGLAVALAVAVALHLCAPSASQDLPIAWWAVFAGIGLGILQLVPMSPAARMILSPSVENLLRLPDPLSDVNGVSGAETSPEPALPPDFPRPNVDRPISISSGLTRIFVAQLAMASAVMLLAVLNFSKQSRLKWILAVVALNGSVVACFGLAERVLSRSLFFSESYVSSLGPFRNRNNGAEFLLLSLAAAVALLCLCLRDRVRGEDRSRSLWSLIAESAFRFDAFAGAALLSTAVLGAAIIASLSRGAVIAFIAGAVAVAVTFAWSGFRKPRSLAWALLVVPALAIPVWLGLFDKIQQRFQTLCDFTALTQNGRLLNWQSGWEAARHFLRGGSGLGSYRYAYRPFETTPAQERFNYPENVFLQTLVEAGVPGLLLLAVGILTVLTAAVQLCRSKDADDRTLGRLGVFLLVAMSVHGCLDNGFYVPANFLLLAALLGIVCGRGAIYFAGKVLGDPAVEHPPSIATSAARLALLLALVWATRELHSAAAGAEVAESLEVFQDVPSFQEADLLERLRTCEAAIAQRPDDAEVRLLAARLYFAVYRRRAIAELRAASPNADGSTLWAQSSAATFYAAACRAIRDGNEFVLESLRNQPAALTTLWPAYRHLSASAAAAPLDGTVQLHLAEMCVLTQSTREVLRRLDLAADLSPSRPALLYVIGIAQIDAGGKSQGFATLRRAWSQDTTLQKPIMEALASRATLEEVVRNVVPSFPPVRRSLAEQLRTAGHADAVVKLLESEP